MRYHTSSSSLRDSRSRFLGLECASSDECVLPKKRITHVRFLKKTSFSFLKSRLKKPEISLGYFHLSKRRLELFPTVYSPHNVYIYIVRTHIEEVYVHAKQLARTVKSARLFSTRAKCFWRKRERAFYI